MGESSRAGVLDYIGRRSGGLRVGRQTCPARPRADPDPLRLVDAPEGRTDREGAVFMMVWLSFCDPKRPKGQQFLGVTIVDIQDTNDDRTMAKLAITTAWLYEANPGGECEATRINPSKEDLFRPHVGRLMGKEELEALGLL